MDGVTQGPVGPTAAAAPVAARAVQRVLVVDGGADAPLATPFAGDGYELRVVDAVEARTALVEFAPDVLVIDLRHADPLLTVRHMSRREEHDRALRLEALVAELSAHPAAVDGRLSFAGLELDLRRHLVAADAGTVALTTTEAVLLALLAVAGDGIVVARRVLLERVWGDVAVSPNVLEVHVSSLRRKLADLRPGLIGTVRGVGYRLDPGLTPHAPSRPTLVP
jgi:DNA-binding response OmpR family regulator